MLKIILSTACLAALAIGPAASALTAEQKVYKLVEKTNALGQVSTSRTSAELVTPGEKIVYVLAYTNDKIEPANDIVLTMPIPSDVTYMEGSAETETAKLEYSAGDGFSARDDLMVIGDDGAMRTARAEELTHVRWTVIAAVAPGQSGELSFKAALK
ncbi:MAG: hypothetical protein V3U82_00960 [Robiginitomaculum sp.]